MRGSLHIFLILIEMGLSKPVHADQSPVAGGDTAFEKPSSDYQVFTDNREQFVYNARVSAMPVNVWPGVKRPLQQTEIAAFCSFDSDQRNLIIKPAVKITDVVIRPLAMHVKYTIVNNEIHFTLDKAGQVVVEVNGWHKALHLFVNPVKKNLSIKKKSGDLYFGPGVHYPGVILAKSNQTIHIAQGAVVYGAILGKGLHDLTIEGEGILDGSRFVRNVDTVNLIMLMQCRNIKVSGIVLRDAQIWTFMTYECDWLVIENIKIIGMWRYNSDGIDLVNSRNVEVKNSFVRAFDDCLVIKGINLMNRPDESIWKIAHISYRNCVVWCDWGRGLEIGAETIADSISHIRYSDIDIIHFVHIAIDIQDGNHAAVSDVLYDNIRVEDPITENAYLDDLENPILDTLVVKTNPGKTKKFIEDELGRLFVIEIQDNGWVKDKSLGSVNHILYKNIRYTSSYTPKSFISGFSADHAVSHIRFENIEVNGKKMKGLDSEGFHINKFVRYLQFDQNLIQ